MIYIKRKTHSWYAFAHTQETQPIYPTLLFQTTLHWYKLLRRIYGCLCQDSKSGCPFSQVDVVLGQAAHSIAYSLHSLWVCLLKLDIVLLPCTIIQLQNMHVCQTMQCAICRPLQCYCCSVKMCAIVLGQQLGKQWQKFSINCFLSQRKLCSGRNVLAILFPY